MANRIRRDDRRAERMAAARRSLKRAVDRDQTRAALKAAGARNVDDAAVEAVAALTEERLAELAARSVESSEDREESKLSASSVAIAAQRGMANE
jgi:acylphosphatase